MNVQPADRTPPSARGRLRAAFVFACLGAAAAVAQPLTLKGARVLVGDGTDLPSASVVMGAGKIGAVATGDDAPERGRVLDLSGKVVTPGLIDVWSTIGLDASGKGRPSASGLDNFDSYDRDALLLALRQGVTCAYIPAGARDAAGGIGAVVRLIPGGERDEVVLRERAGLNVQIGGSGDAGVLARVAASEALRKDLIASLDYRLALETYEEDLKEYVEKIQKSPRDMTDAKEPSTGPAEAPKPAGEPREGRRRRRPPRADEEVLVAAGIFEEQPPEGEKQEGKDEKKDEGPKKPDKPASNVDYDALLEAVDGKLRFRAAAERPEDIQNTLDIAREFNLPLLIEGGSSAWRFADLLSERRTPVVLDSRLAGLAFTGGPLRDRNDCGLAVLIDAGVDVYLASGPRPTGGEINLALLAARAVQFGLPADAAIPTITGRAAELLGVADEVGRVERGLRADLVVWSAHPLAGDARVERVFIGGREVYTAEGVAP